MTATPIVDLALADADPGQDGKATKLLDYLTTQPGHLTAFSDSPLAQSRLLANPSEMAGRAGEYLEGFHQRTEAVRRIGEEPSRSVAASSDTTAAGSAPGPASVLPRASADSASEGAGQLFDSSALERMFEDTMATTGQLMNFSLEMTLVSKTIGGAVGSMNSLLRGQ